jgi:hypothetical protein
MHGLRVAFDDLLVELLKLLQRIVLRPRLTGWSRQRLIATWSGYAGSWLSSAGRTWQTCRICSASLLWVKLTGSAGPRRFPGAGVLSAGNLLQLLHDLLVILHGLLSKLLHLRVLRLLLGELRQLNLRLVFFQQAGGEKLRKLLVLVTGARLRAAELRRPFLPLLCRLTNLLSVSRLGGIRLILLWPNLQHVLPGLLRPG